MRKIAATYIFPVISPPVKNGILICKNNGIVIDIVKTEKNLKEQAGLEYYSGILTPGFVKINGMAVSLMRKIAEKHDSFSGFTNEILHYRINSNNKVVTATDRQLWASGAAFLGETPELPISVIQEMLTLQNYFPKILLNRLIKYVCFDGAKKMQVDNLYGSFEKGKNPGVNIISGIDFKKMRLNPNAKVKRII